MKTICDDMPKLKPYKPSTPVNIKDLNLVHIKTAISNGYACGPRTYRVYANAHYAFVWWDPEPNDPNLPIYNRDVKNLYRPRHMWAWKPGVKTVLWEKPYHLEIVPPKTRLHGHEVLENFEQERLILCKTLLDLDAIIRKNYGMYVLSDELADAYWHHLRAHGI